MNGSTINVQLYSGMGWLGTTDYVLENASELWPAWLKFFAFLWLVSSYGEFHYLLPWS